jgi:hypothetical protein
MTQGRTFLRLSERAPSKGYGVGQSNSESRVKTRRREVFGNSTPTLDGRISTPYNPRDRVLSK